MMSSRSSFLWSVGGGVRTFLVRRQESNTPPKNKKKPNDERLSKSKSLGFFTLIHFCLNGITDKTVKAFPLAGSEVFDDLTLALLDNHIDAVIGFFIVACGRFFLRVVILGMFQIITPLLILA